MADKKKTSLKNEVGDTLACTAFAEAGEPCPIGSKKQSGKAKSAPAKKKGKEKSALKKVEDDLACTAFAEAGEPCPIGGKKKK